MSERKSGIADTTDREIFATRLLDAPRELVWKAFTEPEHIAKWWGPNGFTNTIHIMEVKAGGKWEFIMHGPDGKDFPNKVTYVEVVKPERIVFDHFAPNFRATITFEDEGGKTKLTWKLVFETAEVRNLVVKQHNAVEGLQQNIDKLIVHLAAQ